MRICIKKPIVKVIEKGKYEYRCDICYKKLDKYNRKDTYQSNGKTKHACKKTCSPFRKK